MGVAMTTSLTRIFLYSLLVGFCSLAQSNPLTGHDELSFEMLQAVDNKVLDKMRGGFVVDGVKFDIGFAKGGLCRRHLAVAKQL